MRQLSLKEIHGYLLDILKSVDSFCRERNIRYSMAYGTLLGAVRHKGFIPWDDDIDLLMPRPDFEKFVSSFGKESGARYRCLYDTDTDEASFVHFFAKVHDTRTRCIENVRRYRFGLNIDIFPVDGKPDLDMKAQTKREKLLSHYSHRLNLCSKSLLAAHPLTSGIPAHIMGAQYWQEKCTAEMKRYSFENSRLCGSVAVKFNGLKEIFERSMFENYIELPFEGCMFMAFRDWDEFLVRQFGDYMQLPPEKDRETHNLLAYDLSSEDNVSNA